MAKKTANKSSGNSTRGGRSFPDGRGFPCINPYLTPIDCGIEGGTATGEIVARDPYAFSNLPNLTGNITEAFAAAARENGALGGRPPSG